MARKFRPPFAQSGFANVEALPLFADGLDHNVNVGTGPIGVQGKNVAVLAGEFLSGEILDRRENPLGWCSRRHRENHFVDEPWWLLPASSGQVGLAAVLIQVKVPILDKILSDARTAQPLPVIGFQIKLPSSSDITEML